MLENSEPIGLSNIVISSEYYFERIEPISITQVFTLNIQPKTFKGIFDDSHARFHTREQLLQSVLRHAGQTKFIDITHD